MTDSAAQPRPRSLLSTLPPAASDRERRGRVARLALATVGSLAGAVVMRAWDNRLPGALWIPAGLLALAAVLAHHGQVGSQLVARSVWWTNLVLGTLLSMAGNERERTLGMVLALGTGAALLAMGRLGLDEDERSSFRPVAFRTTLTLGMIMAVADAQALTLFGVLEATEYHADHTHGLLLLGSAALLLIAIIGLYRLRFWGLLLAAVGAVVVAALAGSGAYGVKGALATALVITSLVQLALPVPIIAAIVRRSGPPPSAAPSRLARIAPVVIVTAMMAMSVVVVGVIGRAIVD